MDVVVKGRHTAVPEGFKPVVEEKLSRLSKHDSRLIRVDVEVCEEHNPRWGDRRMRVELTCFTRGPVVRAEAAAAEPLAALDLAASKLETRLRRASDRRRVHHGTRTPVSVAAATAALAAASAGSPVDGDEPGSDDTWDTPPYVVREKDHLAEPMTLEAALHAMELVGHDFYLFVDADHGVPSVVYRRHGYDYGVLRLRETRATVAQSGG